MRQEGVVYGWNTDMSTQCRDWTRVIQKPPTRLLATNCGFNADQRSKWCVTNSETSFLCENAAWMVKLPNREYSVRVTVGDANSASEHNLQINGKDVIRHLNLPAGKFETIHQRVVVTGEMISLEAKCKGRTLQEKADKKPNCEQAWTKVVSLEIEPLIPDYIKQLKGVTTKVPCADVDAFVGGKCVDVNPLNCI